MLAPLGIANGVLGHKERQPMLLRYFKTLCECMMKVQEASSVISQHLRHHSMPKWSESIGQLSWIESAMLAPLGKVNDVLEYKEVQPLLLRYFKSH